MFFENKASFYCCEKSFELGLIFSGYIIRGSQFLGGFPSNSSIVFCHSYILFFKFFKMFIYFEREKDSMSRAEREG